MDKETMASDKSTPMSDEDRAALMKKLDDDLDSFIKERQKSNENVKDPLDDMTVDELAEDLKNHPAFIKEIDVTKPLHPAVQGLIDLKYETDSPDDNAISYKEEGNRHFKRKKYIWATDNYTAGIKEKPESRELNAVLYTNRAAAQFRRGNFRTSLNDTVWARKFKPDHQKAIHKGALCCFEMKKYSDAMKWCDHALLLNPKDAELLELRSKSEKAKTKLERDLRKEAVMERKKQKQEKELLATIEARGIRIAGASGNGKSPLNLSNLEATHPSGATVSLDADNVLHWPVMLLYPEHGETDFICQFSENSRFIDHLNHMFEETPPWDSEAKYKPQNIQMYYEEKEKQKLHKVQKTTTLKDVLQNKTFEVQGGTPGFIILVKDSLFEQSFVKKYN